MSRRLTYEFVKNYIEKENYQLLSTEYKNNSTKLKVKCNKGHEYEVIFNNFKKGDRCPLCPNKKKLDYKFIKEYIEGFNYQLLSTEYIKSNQKIELRCPKGHKYKAKYNSFQQGCRCPVCGNINKQNQPHKNKFKDVKEHIESFGFQLLSKEYKDTNDKLLIICPVNHVFEKSWKRFKKGERCPICWIKYTSSNMEKELQEFVSNNYKGIILNNNRKTVLNPLTNRYLELDIYLPEIKIAIEFNGKYWHSKPERIKCDMIKKEQCKKLGINLIIITEIEWLKNKNKCLNYIKSIIS